MKVIFIFISLLILGCNNEVDTGEMNYGYGNDFKMYLKDAFKQELKTNTSYFIVPLNSCAQCVDSALQKLVDYKLNWRIILTGQTEDKERIKNIRIIKSKYSCLNDSASLISEYSVSIGLPTLLKTNSTTTEILKREFHYGSWLNFNPE